MYVPFSCVTFLLFLTFSTKYYSEIFCSLFNLVDGCCVLDILPVCLNSLYMHVHIFTEIRAQNLLHLIGVIKSVRISFTFCLH